MAEVGTSQNFEFAEGNPEAGRPAGIVGGTLELLQDLRGDLGYSISSLVRHQRMNAARLAVAASLLSACSPASTPLPEATVIETPRSTLVLTERPPTPEPQVQFTTENPFRLSAVSGLPSGFSEDGYEPVRNNQQLQDTINQAGYLPIISQGVGFNITGYEQVVSDTVGEAKIVTVNIPTQFFNPDVAEQKDVILTAEQGVIEYGNPGPDRDPETKDDNIVRAELVPSLSLSAFPDSSTAVAAVVNDPNNDLAVGTLVALLVDEKTGEIQGRMPLVHAPGESEVRWVDGVGPVTSVEGEDVAFELVEPFPTDTPDISATPVISATSTLAATATLRPTDTAEPATATRTETLVPTQAALYAECGPSPDLFEGGPYEGYPKGPDGRGLPTGIQTKSREQNQDFTLSKLTGCLSGVEGISEGNQLDMTMGFYDVRGDYHAYPVVMGGQDASGANKRVAICHTDGSTAKCSSLLTADALAFLQDAFANPGRSRQAHISAVEQDRSAQWNLGAFNPGGDFMSSLFTAIETGDNFPQIDPGKKLVVWKITLVTKN